MTSIAPMNTENCTPTFNLKNYSSSDIFAPQRDVDLKLTWRKKKKKKKKKRKGKRKSFLWGKKYLFYF